MEYVLLGVLVLGVVLFVVGWLVMVGICFQRHAVTGVIALIPGLNLLTLPAMWHRVSGWVITSVIGVLLASVAWFAGANGHVYSRAQAVGLKVGAPVAQVTPASATPAQPAAGEVHTIDIPPQARTAEPAPAPVDVLAGAKTLPAAALYHVVFKTIEVSALANNAGEYVRITQQDGRTREGKLISASAKDINLEERQSGGSVTRTIKLTEISAAARMTHEQGKE